MLQEGVFQNERALLQNSMRDACVQRFPYTAPVLCDTNGKCLDKMQCFLNMFPRLNEQCSGASRGKWNTPETEKV